MKNTDSPNIAAEQTKNANKLLDAVLNKLNLKNDAALSRRLAVAPPVISKIRHGRLPVGPSMLISIHEASEYSIAELKNFLNPRGATAT
jgi:hypothetical protein